MPRWLISIAPVSAVLMILAFRVGAAAAEPLAGTVLDGETLEPVVAATLEISGDSGGTAVTDVNGRFRFADLPAGSIDIRITADGYDPSIENIDLAAGGLDGQVFVLVAPGFAGETIEIEESRSAPVAPGKQQLTRRELTRIPGTRGDALTSLKTLPGVAAVDAPGAGPGLLVIRGAAPEDSTVLLDGIEIPILYHFFGLQSILPSEFIETIDFAPGGFGAEKGRATGGVIEIHTRDKKIDEWTGFAELSFINLAGLVQGPLWKEKNLQVSAAIRRSAIDLILPAVIPDDSDISFTTAPQYYDGQLRVDWLPDPRNRVSLLGLASLDLLTLLNDNIDPNEPLLSGQWDNETAFSRAIATWAYEGERLSNRLVGALGTARFRIEIGDDRFFRIDNSSAEVRNDLRLTVTDEIQLRVGGEARYSGGNLRSRFPLPPSEGGDEQINFSIAPLAERDQSLTNNQAAAYASADVDVMPGLTVTSGLRLDHYAHIDESTLSPRLAVRYRKPKSKWTARFALGNYTRPLQQSEAFQTDLEPEAATQYVLGGEYKLGNGTEASGSLFYTDRRRLVVLDANRNQMDPDTAYVSRGVGRSFGLEGLLRARRDDFFGWIAYTLSRSDRVDDPVSAERLFDFDQTHNFLVVGSYRWRGWEFSGRWQFVTGVPETPVLGSTFIADANIYVPVYGANNSARISAAHQLDIRIDKRWELEHLQLSAYLDVTNVYANPKTLGFFYNFNFSEREAVEELPILPAIGLRGTF